MLRPQAATSSQTAIDTMPARLAPAGKATSGGRSRTFRRPHRNTPDTQHGLCRGRVSFSLRKQRAEGPR